MHQTDTGQVAEVTGRRLRSVLAAEQVTGRLPSVVAGVVRDGVLAWAGGRGHYAGREDPGPDLQYRIGSLTKTLTAVLVLQLRDEGRLLLADPVSAHLGNVPYGDRSIRSLLAHSSGMQSEPPGEWWERAEGRSFEEVMSSVDQDVAPFPAGATFHYTNLAYAMLGEVVARLRGDSWWACLEARVLTPLGMRRTSYLPRRPHAQGFSVHPFAGTLTSEPATDTRAMAPAGQLWSTVEDLARFAAFLSDGHRWVLSRESLDEMCTPQLGTPGGDLSTGYGLGLRLLAGGSGTRVGHTGSMPGFQASLFVDRARRSGAVVLANSTTGLRSEVVAPLLLDTLEASEPHVPAAWTPAESVPEPAAEVLGVWHWGNTAQVFRWSGSQVVVSDLLGGHIRDTFDLHDDGSLVGSGGYHHGEVLHVVRNPDGSVKHLECATFVLTRVPYDPAAPIPGGPPH